MISLYFPGKHFKTVSITYISRIEKLFAKIFEKNLVNYLGDAKFILLLCHFIFPENYQKI